MTDGPFTEKDCNFDRDGEFEPKMTLSRANRRFREIIGELRSSGLLFTKEDLEKCTTVYSSSGMMDSYHWCVNRVPGDDMKAKLICVEELKETK